MKHSSTTRDAVRSAKWNLYVIVFLNGVFIHFLAPFQYKCDFTEEKCFACGLRTAVNLFLQGKFSAAYQSNKLIVVLILAVVIMAADVLSYLYRRKKVKQHGTT